MHKGMKLHRSVQHFKTEGQNFLLCGRSRRITADWHTASLRVAPIQTPAPPYLLIIQSDPALLLYFAEASLCIAQSAAMRGAFCASCGLQRRDALTCHKPASRQPDCPPCCWAGAGRGDARAVHLGLQAELEGLRLLRHAERRRRHRDGHRQVLLLVRVVQGLRPRAQERKPGPLAVCGPSIMRDDINTMSFTTLLSAQMAEWYFCHEGCPSQPWRGRKPGPSAVCGPNVMRAPR